MLSFYTLNPALQALPQFLKDNKYQNITDTMTGPFPKAHNSDLHPFIWVQTQPQNLGWFVQFMDVYHEGKAPWTRVVPFVEQCRARDSNAPLFVDVGGGLGSQCVAFLQATPGIEGRVILQDLPETLQQGPAHEGVEKMAQNFFEPQAVKGEPNPRLQTRTQSRSKLTGSHSQARNTISSATSCTITPTTDASPS